MGRAAGKQIGGREQRSHWEHFIRSKVNRTETFTGLSLTLVRRLPAAFNQDAGASRRKGGGEATKPAPMKKPDSLSGIKENDLNVCVNSIIHSRYYHYIYESHHCGKREERGED